MEDLERVKAKDGYVHWFSDLRIIWGLRKRRVPLSATRQWELKQYKNKILGLRGRSTGLVFGMFDEKCHILKPMPLLH